jgi:hypothetical protein
MALDIRIRFGRAIRRIREEQEINQEEAAARRGLHRTLERGVRNVSLVRQHLCRLPCGDATPRPRTFAAQGRNLGRMERARRNVTNLGSAG